MCWFGPLVHASAALFAEPGFARGDLPAVEIRCAPLTREQTAEVEARARANLMTSGLPVLAADLECSSNRVTITVSAERASNTRTAALYGQNVREALIEALDAALLSLMHPEPAVSPLPESHCLRAERLDRKRFRVVRARGSRRSPLVRWRAGDPPASNGDQAGGGRRAASR